MTLESRDRDKSRVSSCVEWVRRVKGSFVTRETSKWIPLPEDGTLVSDCETNFFIGLKSENPYQRVTQPKTKVDHQFQSIMCFSFSSGPSWSLLEPLI